MHKHIDIHPHTHVTTHTGLPTLDSRHFDSQKRSFYLLQKQRMHAALEQVWRGITQCVTIIMMGATVIVVVCTTSCRLKREIVQW